MIQTSQIYKQLFEEKSIQDYRVVIDGVEYTQEHIKGTINLQQNLFDKSTFTVGSFTIGILKLKLTVPSNEIPHNASVVFSYRYNNGETQSEWIDKFKGNITKRTIHGDALTEIEVKDRASNYDKFLDYFGESLSKYPANTREVANLCASHLGLEIDNIEDVINLDIVEYPNENTIVEMLKEVATNSGGNWVIVGDKLRLVITGNKLGLSYPARSIKENALLSPISKVLIYYANLTAFESGTDIGSTLEADSKWATQESADYVHSILNGYEYRPLKVTGAYVDPALELGDIIVIDDEEVLMANVKWEFDGSVIVDIEVPITGEVNYDDPYNKMMQSQFDRKVTLGDSYQGVTISRDKGIEMLVSPDGTEDNAIGRYYADLYRGIAFQTRDSANDEWFDWMYFDMNEKVFKLELYSTKTELQEAIDEIELTPGPPGQDAVQWTIGSDGYWYADGVKTDKKAIGEDGSDADIWTIGANGNWFKNGVDTGQPSKGPKGDKGDQGIQGPKGADGQSQYVHIRYSENASGSDFVTAPISSTKYIGIANTTSSTAPTSASAYTWSKYVGEDGEQGPQGIQGPKGDNGQPTYTWVKYADTPTSGMSDYPEGKKYIGLAFNKTTQTESTNYGDYQWSLMPQNIEIGGRNLVVDSNYKVVNSCDYLVRRYDLSEPFVENEKYTFSMRFRNSEIGTRDRFWVYNSGGMINQGTIKYVPNENWQTVSVTFNSKSFGNNNRIYLYHATSTQTGCVDIDWVKLEKGDVATDWTPAPEDVQNEITRVETEATAKITANTESISLEKSERETQYGTLENVVSEQGSTLTMLNDQINTTIETRLTDAEGTLETINETISTVESTQQTFTDRITNLEGEMTEQQTFFRTGMDGLTIGGTDWETVMHADGERISFQSQAGDVEAQFGAGGMYVNRWETDFHTIEKFEEGSAKGTIFKNRKGGS